MCRFVTLVPLQFLLEPMAQFKLLKQPETPDVFIGDEMIAKLNASTDQDRLTFTVEEAAKVLGIGRNTAYEAVRTGEIPCLRVGGRILVPKAAVNRLLENPANKPA